jgi:HEAT repeats
MPTEPKAEAAARALKQFALALKTSALYSASHPGRVRAVDALLTSLQGYLNAHGPFSVTIGKRTLSVDGIPIDSRYYSNLAHLLYSRKLSEFTVMPTVSQPQLAAFVSIVSRERNDLEASGGVEHLLWESGVWDIQVKELALHADEEVEILGLSAFFSLVGRGRLTPQEREQVIEILRSGSEQVAKFLQNIYALAGKALEGVDEDGRVQHVYEAIRSLDRLILDEPFDQQRPLYTHLAEAALRLEEPLGRRLAEVLLSGAGEDVAMQVILSRLSHDQLAAMMLMAVQPGRVVEQVTTFMRGLARDREEAMSILSILDARLPREAAGGVSLTDAVGPSLQPPPAPDEDAPPLPAFDEQQLAISDEEFARYRREVNAIDETGAIREAIKTLIDVLGDEMEDRELTDVGDTVAGHLPWLVEHGEFALLRKLLETLKAITLTASGSRAEIITGLLESVTGGPLLDVLLTALWDEREKPAEQDIQACLGALADELIDPLVSALGTEPRSRMRGILCDLLVRIGADHVDVLGGFVSDNRWYLVRNIAYILGRIRSPQAVPYLARIIQHSDSRVRVETVDALASIGTDAAQTLISTFLNDPEQAVRLRALRSLDIRGMQAAMPTLLSLLEMRDPFNRLFVLKQAAIEAVARVAPRNALVVLSKMAKRRFILGQRGRELRRMARMAVAVIAEAPVGERSPVQAKGSGGKAS